jgi:type VI secretion system protein VasI
VDLKRVVGAVLLGVLALGIIGWASSRSRKADASQVVQATPTDKWHVTEEQSPMDDSKTVVLALESDDEMHGPLGAFRPSLIVRCQEKKTEVYVATGMAASVEGHGEYSIAPEDSHTVRTRLNDAVASTEYWYESTDQKALFTERDSIEFAKALTGAMTFTFQFTPFDGSPQVTRFDVRGLDPHLHKVAEACGWAYE